MSIEAMKRRRAIIEQLEKERNSKVLTYFLSDRQGAVAQVGEDAVRPMYDHLRAFGPAKRVDLFLYSRGGQTDVPWRIVTMIREVAEEFAVLVPYRAASAATMIAIGADEIVMGPKGELGPIDPQFSIQRGQGGTAVQEQIAVEDVIAYIRFLREKAGLSDQAALAGPIAALATKLDPWLLGSINRAHSHIRSVARKLLTARGKQAPLDEQRIQVIVEALAEKTYQHGHAIGRFEATEIGLPIARAGEKVEPLLWNLYREYEELCQLQNPVDARTFLPTGQDKHFERATMACIESLELAHEFAAEIHVQARRQPSPQLNLNLNFNVQLPASLDAQNLPAAVQQAVQQLLQQLQQQAGALIQQQVASQMPIIEYQGWTQNGAWRGVADWSVAKEG